MKKILQINKFYYPKIGGIERIVQQIAEGLNKESGFQIDVLCCDKKEELEEVNGVRVWRTKILAKVFGMPISFDFFKTFKKIRNNYQILDFHQPFPLADLALFLFPTKAKIVVHYHSDIVRQRIVEIFVKPFIFNTLKKAKKIVVSNPNLIETSPILKRFQKKCVVVPFGVDISKFQNIDSSRVEEIKKKYSKFVLFVGRLSYYKGVEYLIKAIQKIPVNLVIIGEGPKRGKLERLVKKLKLKDKVFFLPFQREKNLKHFYHACFLFVLPSVYRSEAFGIVLIEAMACKKPVISTELGTGTSWVNQNNVTGFVVEPKNVEQLTRAIKKIINDIEIYQRFSENAFLRAREIFDEKKMLDKIKKVYLNI